ncbi:MAG TPA: hypothetical protein VIT88_15000, partial [Pyrinomonadaceae bacterium]
IARKNRRAGGRVNLTNLPNGFRNNWAADRVEVIAKGPSVRARSRLRKNHGGTKWRKLKGVANVRLPDGTIRLAEIHWYEARGVGKRELKLKLPFLD